MLIVFYISGAVAVVASILAVTRANAMHALLFLIASFLGMAATFYTLGASFAAALEIVVYAGAIAVLFLFVIMILNIGRATSDRERAMMKPKVWILPTLLVAVLAVELGILFARTHFGTAQSTVVSPRAVGTRLFAPYLLSVEIASFLLLAGVVGAFHLGRRHFERRADAEAASGAESSRADGSPGAAVSGAPNAARGTQASPAGGTEARTTSKNPVNQEGATR